MILFSLLRLYLWLVLIRAVLSWFNPDPTHPLVRLLVAVTEPVLAPIRRIVPPIGGRIDLSPLILFLLAQWLLSRLRF
ncbi:MAG: YggT family protein [Candidatus Latescibacteria bacterium]|nr:YggT family protein [Candidatus Latescibacterota bacterium]